MARLTVRGDLNDVSLTLFADAAPEIITGQPYDATRTDVWSIGVIFYALLTGTLPFDHENIPTLLQMVCRGNYTSL